MKVDRVFFEHVVKSFHPMGNVIEIKDLVVRYADKKAVDGLSFSVPSGQIFGFIGPNGAGKSTTLKAILGLVFPQSGSVRVHGFSPTDPKSRLKIGFMPEEATYYRFLNPKEILSFYGDIFGIERAKLKRRVEYLLDLVGLSKAAGQRLGTFSKGMAQRVSLAQALIQDPETLILDEPTTGLDPLAKMQLRTILADLKNKGKTIFFSSHELSEVELLCDSVVIIRSGKMLCSGALKEVLGGQGSHSLEQFFLEVMK